MNELVINCQGTTTTNTWAINPAYAVGKNTIISTGHLSLKGTAVVTPSTYLKVNA
jgi:hypothetical protein